MERECRTSECHASPTLAFAIQRWQTEELPATSHVVPIILQRRAVGNSVIETEDRAASLHERLHLVLQFAVDFAFRSTQHVLVNASTAQRAGAIVRAEIPGAWDTLRELMGEEQACLAFYLQPDLVRDILHTIQDTSLRVLERIQEVLTVDQLFIHDGTNWTAGNI